MSIFQTRDKWGTCVGDHEEFDTRSIHIENIDNSNPPAPKIIIGSFEGLLRIYSPQLREFRIEDLLLERNLESSILQLGSGKLTNSGELALAVLHKRKLSVYSVTTDPSKGSTLKVQYEHILTRNGYSFCTGEFGSSSKEGICVLSIDGLLSFYQYQSPLFTIQLSDFLLPGPITYFPLEDIISVANSALEVEAYKYNSLAAIANTPNKEKKLLPDWSLVLGENVQQLDYIYNRTRKKGELVALGDQTLFTISATGFPLFMKRMDYQPSCMHIYQNESQPEQHEFDPNKKNMCYFSALMGSHSSHILVYRNGTLMWAAGLPHPPIFLSRITINPITDMIVSLADNGWLRISYLGTDPPVQTLNFPMVQKQVRIEEVEREHKRLTFLIQKYESQAKIQPDDKLFIKAQILPPSSAKDYIDDPQGLIANAPGSNKKLQVVVKLMLSYSGKMNAKLRNLQIQLTPCKGLKVDQPYIFIEDYVASTPLVLPLRVFALKTVIPYSPTVSVRASFALNESQSQQRATFHTIKIPLGLFCVVARTNTASQPIKITIVTNKNPPIVKGLFPDVVESSGVVTEPLAMTFSYHSDAEVTLQISKNTGKYRLQAQSPEPLCLFLQELMDRLHFYYETKDTEGDKLAITYESELLLGPQNELIDKHMELRTLIDKHKVTMEKYTAQYRNIQKRLLVRFKDKNPAPLNNMDALLGNTYNDIINLANLIQGLETQLEEVTDSLSSLIHINLLLMKLKFSLSDEESEILRHYLSPDIDNNSEQGWEELTLTNISYLISKCLAKGTKESAIVVGAIRPLTDTTRLKKNIKVLVDRISKGAKVYL